MFSFSNKGGLAVSILVLVLSFAVWACSSSSGSSGKDTTTQDTAGNEVANDTLPQDTAVDTLPDTLIPPDTTADTLPDTSPDTAQDTLVDTTPDTPQDTEVLPCAAEGNIANLRTCAEGAVTVTLKGVVVTYVFNSGYFVQDASGAIEVYTGATPSYTLPAVGKKIDLLVTEWGNYKNQQEVTASDAPVEVGDGDVEALKTDLSAGVLPSEENESFVVKGTGFEVITVAGKDAVVKYGTASDVMLRIEIDENGLCVGAKFNLASGVIDQYDADHRIHLWYLADLSDLNTDACPKEDVPDMSNWGFEESKTDDPPPDFEKTTLAFTANRVTSEFHTGAAACKLTWTSTDNQDFYQTYYFPVTVGKNLTFKAWFKDNDAGGKARLGLIFYKADMTKFPGGLDDYSATYTADSADWAEHSFTRLVPADAAFARGLVRMYDVTWGTTITSATVYVDDWSMAESTPAN